MESATEFQLICRACLKVVDGTNQSYGYVEDATGNLRDMLLWCIPEMDIFVSLNPIVCIQCIHALINIYQFKSRCINTESIIRNYMKKLNLSDEDPVNLSAVVHDLIQINNFYKYQEELRRQMVMEQHRNNLVYHHAPRPCLTDPHTNAKMQEDPNTPGTLNMQIHPNALNNIKNYSTSETYPTIPVDPNLQKKSNIENHITMQNDYNKPVNPNIKNNSNNQNPFSIQNILNIPANPHLQNNPNIRDHPSLQNYPNMQLRPNIENHINVPTNPSLHNNPHLQNHVFQTQYNNQINPNKPIVEHQPSLASHPLPPLHFLEGYAHNMANKSMPVREYPRMPQQSFVRFRPPSGFMSHSNGLFHIRPLSPVQSVGPAPPLLPMPAEESPHLINDNGLSIPKEVSNHKNILDYLSFPKPALISSNIPSVATDEANISKIETNEKILVETSDSNLITDECTPETKNKITYHPIENKWRLVIKLPRIPLNKTKLSDIEDQEMENVHDENNKEIDDIQMEDEIPHLTDEIQGDFADDIPEDYPEYLPEDINQLYDSENRDIPQHKNITKLYNCPCMYLTTSQTLFEEHKKRCKSGAQNKSMVKCPHCPHVTNRPYALNKHINTMHTKAVWYHCESCSYRSTDKSCLRRHVRKNHEINSEGELPKQFCCTVCNMTIASEYNFHRHMMKHEEATVANYECVFCSYTSKDRSNYRKHIFTHSPIQLQCPSCPYSNVSPYQLRSHIKKFHDGAGIEAADCKSEVPIVEIINDIKEVLDSVDCLQRNQSR